MSGRLVDAILVARDLLQRYPQICDARLARHELGEDNQFAARAIAVRETAGEGAHSILSAVESSCAQAQAIDSYGITIIPVPASIVSVVISDNGEPKSGDRVMRSILQRYQSHAVIRYVDNLNECWKRFVVCKELSHLIMGEADGERAVNVEQQLAMAYAICNDAKADMDLSGEQFAWFVAAELLLPAGDRHEVLSRKAGGESTLSIARSYRTPTAIVNMLFDTPYGELSNGMI